MANKILIKGRLNTVGEALLYWAKGNNIYHNGRKINYLKPPVRFDPEAMVKFPIIYFNPEGCDHLEVADALDLQTEDYSLNTDKTNDENNKEALGSQGGSPASQNS